MNNRSMKMYLLNAPLYNSKTKQKPKGKMKGAVRSNEQKIKYNLKETSFRESFQNRSLMTIYITSRSKRLSIPVEFLLVLIIYFYLNKFRQLVYTS